MSDLDLQKIQYSELNAKQKEIYNFQKLAAKLANYGFNCMKLADDWQGADFLAYHKDGESTLKVQLKSTISISKKYQGKDIVMAFPCKKEWYLVPHDELVEIIKSHTSWLNTDSWLRGSYHSASPSQKLLVELSKFKLED